MSRSNQGRRVRVFFWKMGIVNWQNSVWGLGEENSLSLLYSEALPWILIQLRQFWRVGQWSLRHDPHRM